MVYTSVVPGRKWVPARRCRLFGHLANLETPEGNLERWPRRRRLRRVDNRHERRAQSRILLGSLQHFADFGNSEVDAEEVVHRPGLDQTSPLPARDGFSRDPEFFREFFRFQAERFPRASDLLWS